MKFTETELKKIAAGAAFLRERLAGNTLFRPDEDGKRFGRWQKKAGGSGGESVFRQRLAADGISAERAREIAGPAVWNEACPLPDWTKQLQRLFENQTREIQAPRYFNLESYLQDWQEKSSGQEEALAEVRAVMLSLLPWVAAAEHELAGKATDLSQDFTGQALTDLSVMLGRGLYYLVHKVWAERLRIFILRRESFAFLLNLSGEDKRRYQDLFAESLTSDGWQELLTNYPVLARFLVIVTDNWVNSVAELARFLAADRTQLEKELNGSAPLGKVQAVQGSISDAHNKGRGVLILTFASGVKIVYKPRNLGIDLAYERLVGTLTGMDFPEALQAPRAVDAGDHGWIEYIENRSLDHPEQAGAYYRRAGALLALSYMLCGNDFHGENLIARGEHPVLVDLETVLSYKLIQFNEDDENRQEAQDFIDLLQESVLGMGFLPIWLKASEEISVDFGALTGSVKSSIPNDRGQAVSVFEHQRELREGFARAYDFFLANRDRLAPAIERIFSAVRLRIIIRPTQVYAKMLYHTLSPEFLKDGFLYSAEIERLAPAFLIKVADDKVRRIWEVFLSEKEALEARDIPLFHGDAGELRICGGERILAEDYFADSALTRVHKKLLALNAADRARQLDFIQQSLALYARGCHEEGPGPESAGLCGEVGFAGTEKSGGSGEMEKANSKWGTAAIGEAAEMTGVIATPVSRALLVEAQSIYARIMQRSVKLSAKNFSWIAYTYDLRFNRIAIGQTTANLYDGVFGIALFMAALYRLTGQEEYKEKAGLLIGPFRGGLRDPAYTLPVYRLPLGLAHGLGGVIKALFLLGDYLEDEAIQRDALFLADKITAEQIKKTGDLTVYTGLAGIIPPLIACFSRFQHERSLELAGMAAEQILKVRDKTKERLLPIGFGCGSGGVLHALGQLQPITGDERLTTAVLTMITQLKEMETLSGSLCSGAPGLGTAYLGVLPFGGQRPIRAALAEIVQATLDSPPASGDHFCCGESGRVEFLLEAGLGLERPELLAEAQTRMLNIIARKEQGGAYRILGRDCAAVFNPSFFQGLAGIGYEMLRCLDPLRIPSVLR